MKVAQGVTCLAATLLCLPLEGCLSGKARTIDGRQETPIEFGRRLADEASNPLGLTPPSLKEEGAGDIDRLVGSFTPQPSHPTKDIWQAVETYCASIGGSATDVNGICRDRGGHGLFAISLQPVNHDGTRILSIDLKAPRSVPSPSFDAWVADKDRQQLYQTERVVAAQRAKADAAAAAAQRSVAIYSSVPVGTLMCTQIQQGLSKGKFSAYVESKADGNYQLRVANVDGVLPGQAFQYQDLSKSMVWLRLGQVFWDHPLGWLPCNGTA